MIIDLDGCVLLKENDIGNYNVVDKYNYLGPLIVSNNGECEDKINRRFITVTNQNKVKLINSPIFSGWRVYNGDTQGELTR